MKSNYRKIGDFIRKVDKRNRELKVSKLYGLSMTKKFRESTSNIVGTNMARYKIVEKYQFACDFMSPIRVGKLPVVLKLDDEPILVSPAYPVFEIKNKNKLDPEYLMMWFRRPEFDRYVSFKCDGAVRGGYGWEELCETELPVPSIEKQRAIVKEYNTVVNRIKLNEQLNQKLEETAQALYKHWFVDFEFPDAHGNPYKSSGGEMVWNEELEKEIPVGWEVMSIEDFCLKMTSGATPNRNKNEYWNSNFIPWVKTGELNNRVIINAEEYISEEGFKNSSVKILPKNSVLIAMYGQGNTKGQVGYLKIEATTNQACCAMICKNEKFSSYLYYFLRINRDEIANLAIGGAQPNLSKALIGALDIIKPSEENLRKHPFDKILSSREYFENENEKLKYIKDLLLSKMSDSQRGIIFTT